MNIITTHPRVPWEISKGHRSTLDAIQKQSLKVALGRAAKIRLKRAPGKPRVI